MRYAFVALLLCSCASLGRAPASSTSTIYYAGEGVTTSADGSVARRAYLIARTSDPVAGTIAEKAVTFTRGRYAEDASVMRVDGNHVSMSAGGAEGKGELTGKPWEWTFLRLEFEFPQYQLRIVDFNFLAEERTSIQGHKDFYREGKLFQQEDVTLHAIEKAAYEAKRAELLRN